MLQQDVPSDSNFTELYVGVIRCKLTHYNKQQVCQKKTGF